MLRKLLEPPSAAAAAGGVATGMPLAAREETKLRAAMMLSKVNLSLFTLLEPPSTAAAGGGGCRQTLAARD